MQIPTFAEDGDHRRLSVQQFTNVGILFNGVTRKPGGAEGCQLRMPELQLLARAFKKLLVLGVGSGPAAFDIVDPELIELLSNEELILYGKRDGLALSAVSKSGIEGLDFPKVTS